jgi:hypothetical protein
MKKYILIKVLLLTVLVLGHSVKALAEETQDLFDTNEDQRKYCINDTTFHPQILREETKHQQKIKISSIDCIVDYSRTHDNQPLTNVTVSVRLASSIGSQLPLRTPLSAYGQWRQKLTKAEACKTADSFKEYVVKNGYSVPAIVKNEGLFKHEWISTQDGKPVHQIFMEGIAISFGDKFNFTGQARKEIIHPYCSGLLVPADIRI